jgi:YidC/Oxa1 family membrane protein insertase
MREDNRNLLLAIVLSVAVLLGWNVFFAPPPAPPRTDAAQTVPNQPGTPCRRGLLPRARRAGLPCPFLEPFRQQPLR